MARLPRRMGLSASSRRRSLGSRRKGPNAIARSAVAVFRSATLNLI